MYASTNKFSHLSPVAEGPRLMLKSVTLAWRELYRPLLLWPPSVWAAQANGHPCPAPALWSAVDLHQQLTRWTSSWPWCLPKEPFLALQISRLLWHTAGRQFILVHTVCHYTCTRGISLYLYTRYVIILVHTVCHYTYTHGISLYLYTRYVIILVHTV